MSLFKNRFWDAVENWQYGLANLIFTALMIAAGGIYVAVIFVVVVVLPIEILTGKSDIEEYIETAFVIGSATLGVYMYQTRGLPNFTKPKGGTPERNINGD